MGELKKLGDIIAGLDVPERGAMIDLVGALVKQHIHRNQKIALVQEAISSLRVDIKYLTFDLEATRRERDALKP